MAKKTGTSIEWSLNVNPKDGRVRQGWQDVGYKPFSEYIAGAYYPDLQVSQIGEVWDASGLVGTVSVPASFKFCKIQRWRGVRWDSSSSSWVRSSNKFLILTGAGVYVYDANASTKLKVVQMSAAGTPILANVGSGSIPAGTYHYKITEVDEHGTESSAGPPATITLSTPDNVVITKPATVNAGAVKWRIYRSTRNAADPTSCAYNLVKTENIATTSYTDSKIAADLGILYNEARLSTPAKCKSVCVWNGVLVYTNNADEPGTVYISELVHDTDNDGYEGFPTCGMIYGTVDIPDGNPVRAVVALHDRLYIFTTGSVWMINMFPWDEGYFLYQISDSIGVRDWKTVDVCGNTIYWLDANDNLFYLTYGSNKIKRFSDAREGVLSGLSYFLRPLASPEARYSSDYAWAYPMVVSTGERVYIGGEIILREYADGTDYTGGWGSVENSNPWGHRQAVWFEIYDAQVEPVGVWTTPSLMYIDQNGYGYTAIGGRVWQERKSGCIDGDEFGWICEGTVNLGTSLTTITFSGDTIGTTLQRWSPVYLITPNGEVKIRYLMSNTNTSITVDKAIDIDEVGTKLVVGVVPADVWGIPTSPAYVPEVLLDYTNTFTRDGVLFAQVWAREARDSVWQNGDEFWPADGYTNKIWCGITGHVQVRCLIWPLYGDRVIFPTLFGEAINQGWS